MAIEVLKENLERYIDGRLHNLQAEDQENMLKQIGNPDSYLRDDLIYQSFGKLIFSNQLHAKELANLLVRLKEDYLFYRIGEQGTDSVFTRSFSILVVAAIIEYDVVRLRLDEHEIEHTVKRVVEYMLDEKDTRGFVEGKGWAHAIAHGADTLDALAKHSKLKKENRIEILYAIEYSLVRQVDYLDEEEERLAMIIFSLLKHNDAEEEIQLWIEKIVGIVQTKLQENRGSIEAYHTQRTVKNFLKSVYIILASKKQGQKVKKDVFDILEQWMYLRNDEKGIKADE